MLEWQLSGSLLVIVLRWCGIMSTMVALVRCGRSVRSSDLAGAAAVVLCVVVDARLPDLGRACRAFVLNGNLGFQHTLSRTAW